MERIRKPFQGILNIIRFNRHFYLFAFALVAGIFIISNFLYHPYQKAGNIIAGVIAAILFISVLVSFYVYDFSALYKLSWIDDLPIDHINNIINIHAGFDETSLLLKDKFPNSALIVFDFYNPLKHTEVSIKRARKYGLRYANTQQVETAALPLQENYADIIFVILSAHEIRDEQERNVFFTELKRILKPTGKIIITEHLRDLPNFLAYNIGFFHFISKNAWYRAFKNAGLIIYKESNITPFIKNFILTKNGTPS